jgi:anti-sigma factor RsiW
LVPDVSASLLVAHALFAQDESLLDVTGDAATIASWFQDEVGLRVAAPELEGYELLGGRLTTIDGQATAQLVYEAPTDETYLSLLRFADPGTGAVWGPTSDGVTSVRQGTVSLISWPAEGERVALVGTIPESELRRLAGGIGAVTAS